MKTGVLLLNLGTPDSPNPPEVGRYLREFLMDPYVVDIPAPARWFLVNVLIVPRRAHASSELYKKVWMKEGSPLMHFSRDLTAKVQHALGESYVVRLGMRYGNPSVESALRALKEAGVDRIIALPLYPQYSLAATKSSEQKILEVAKKLDLIAPRILGAFYDDPRYLDAAAEISRPYLESRPWDLALFSFHGLPERHVKRTEQTSPHCLERPDCCATVPKENPDCYRAQCFATARELAKRLDIPPSKYQVAFQSRLGRTPWIKPHSDEYYRTFPAQGIKRLAVLSPSFVADCLETLEEISIRGKEEFVECGGEDLFLVPSLNGEAPWIKAVASMVSDGTKGQ